MPTSIFKVNQGAHNESCVKECNELRKHLIVWAQNQATGKRVQANIGKTKKHYDEHMAKAESYDFMVKYLAGMEIRE